MKNLLRYSVLILMISANAFLTGCEKDEENNTADKTSLLTAHIWNFDKLSTTSTDSDIQLFVNLMSVFMTDATLNFSNNGTYTMTVLGESESGTWELSKDGTKLNLDDEGQATVSILTSDVLEFAESTVDDELGSFNVTYRWVK